MSDYNDGLVPEPCLRLSYGFGQQYASVELGDGTGYVRVTDDLRSEHHEMKRWYDNVLSETLDENAKLLELAHLVADYVSVDQCEGCVTKRACNAGELDMCWIRKAILEKLRELKVEVDE